MPTEPQSQPLVSIIVPVYNAGDDIARCIEIIAAQTYRNLEDHSAQRWQEGCQLCRLPELCRY